MYQIDAESIVTASETGKRWLVQIVTNHEHYTSEPVVEFYDFDQDHAKFGPCGQFVSSYYLSTLLERDRSGGLDLAGDVRGWQLDAPTCTRVTNWVEDWAKWNYVPTSR